MQIELHNDQINKIWDVFKMHPTEFIDKMIPFRQVNPDTIISICNSYFKFPVNTKLRSPVIVRARSICMTLMSEFSQVTHHEIAFHFDMDQSSVAHAKKRTYENMRDRNWNTDYTKLKILINSANHEVS